MQKRVLIVKGGRWGEAKETDYQDIIDLIKNSLERVMIPLPHSSGVSKKAVEVQVLSLSEAQKIVMVHPKPFAIVFVSRGMEVAAVKLAVENPNIRVVVFTGSIPGGKVIWVSKNSIIKEEMIRKIVLY